MNNDTRILGRHLARELTPEEMHRVSGGKCFDTSCDKGDGKGWVPDDWSVPGDSLVQQ